MPRNFTISRKNKHKSRVTRIYKNNKNKNNNNRRTRRNNFTAGNGDKVQCCMCEKRINKDDTLVPSGCLVEHGKRAHRICSNCWWDPEKGFAREGVKHRCPGCIKNIPLTPYKKEPTITIDLTEE
jgi:hypothetical protein